MSMQGGEEMELGKQIKKLRQEAQLSQEELAERIYVSRQTISNWENDKSYPDVNSLVLLSETFQISLDKLIKGDIEVMKGVIQKEEIEKMNRYGRIYTMILIASAVSAVPLFMLLGVWALIPCGIIWGIAMYFAFMLKKIKKDNDVQTYKEIVAFSEGQLLDDIQKQREIGKRQFRLMNVLKDTAYPVDQTGQAFLFYKLSSACLPTMRSFSFFKIAITSGCVGVNLTPLFSIPMTFLAFCSISFAVCSLVSMR